MIKGLCSAGIWSEDLTKSLLPFYRDVIGLPVAMDTPGFVVLGTDPRNASVTLGTHSEVKGMNVDGPRHMVGLEVDDVRAEFERLRAKKVDFVDEPQDFPNVVVCTLRDPEGNYVQLLQFKQ
jgi:predicted enzyme related to lactoylglutathione lyase